MTRDSRNMINQKILFTLATLALVSLACSTSFLGVPIALTTPTPRVLPTSGLPEPDQTTTSPTLTESKLGIVCFDESIVNGNLRVRECPGLACKEIGILANGDQIVTTGERRDVDNVTWLRIAAPSAGWVNIRYVCEQ